MWHHSTHSDVEDCRGLRQNHQPSAAQSSSVRCIGPDDSSWTPAHAIQPQKYHYYFDGETTPRFTFDATPFWTATIPPFTAPLSLESKASSGGYVTYFPIGFAESLRITTTGQTPQIPDYYNIG